MLVFRILGTCCVGLSIFTAFFKNCVIFKDIVDNDSRLVRNVGGWTAYSWLWRAFVIVVLWII